VRESIGGFNQEIRHFRGSRDQGSGILEAMGDREQVIASANVLAVRADLRAVILVEGRSDQMAVEALAERRERDLAADGVFVVPIGGATNIGHFLEVFGPGGAGVRLAGLCDVGEEAAFRRAL